jgi:hypothetical protein
MWDLLVELVQSWYALVLFIGMAFGSFFYSFTRQALRRLIRIEESRDGGQVHVDLWESHQRVQRLEAENAELKKALMERAAAQLPRLPGNFSVAPIRVEVEPEEPEPLEARVVRLERRAGLGGYRDPEES